MAQDMVEHVRDALVAREPHRGVHRGRVDFFICRALIQQTERVAHAAVGKPGYQLRRVMRERKLLLPGDIFKVFRDLRRVDAAEAVPLAAGEDRRGDLLQLRRGEDEHQVLGRLLKYFQQGVERRGGEHVHLVDDVHALFYRRGREHCLLPQGADVVDAVVGRGVQLHNVEHGAVRDAAARRAHPAGVAVDLVLAVDRLGEDARAGGFARAARADEDICVRQAPGLHLVFQRLGNMLLSDDLVKGLRPPFAVQRLIHDAPSLALGSLMDIVMALDKTAHPTSNNGLCPLRRQPARTRLPRGTRKAPLNAARFPA